MPGLKPKQWEAARRVEEHLLVAAGAGTGKTTTVVARILYLLGAEVEGERRADPVALHQIGAITYTNAAAADLQRKLRKGLRKAGLRDVADEVDNARIGTIHSFCGDILREFALRAGRDPRARVIEEGEGSALAAEVARETLLEELERGAIPRLEDLLSLYKVSDVESWVAGLIGDSDRLLRILEKRAAHAPLEKALLDLSERALLRMSTRLSSDGAIDFDRMITWTRDLLRQQAPVRRALQRRLHTLILDEFQDVDPVQREIAYLLGDPESGNPSTTRLMLVGDPKQSIYRFRRADVAVWTGVERDFTERGLGTVVALEENFRSVSPILAFVDTAIGAELDIPIEGDRHEPFEVRYTPVVPTREPLDATAVVELLVIPPDAEGKAWKAEESRRIEAAAVADRARELREGGVKPKDMAVLLAAWSDVGIYEDALRNAGLPTYTLRAEGFYDCREVLDLILALEVVRDPRDDRALFGWLRSPFVGVRDETLLALARAGAPPRWDHLDLAETGEPELLRSASAMLREHVALRDRIPTSELLERLIERTGYLAWLALSGETGLQAIANVRKLIRMARQQPEQGVGDFLRAVREARARNVKEGMARLYGEDDDVVTITTIHSAKGLEWPVVFWCDLGRAPIRGVNGSLVVGRSGLALRDPDQDEQSEQWNTLSLAEEREGHAERKRLWYVAATRAMDRLIVGGFSAVRMNAHCPGAALWKHLGRGNPVDGALVDITGHDGRRSSALIRICEVPLELEREDIPGEGIAVEAALAGVPELPVPLAPIAMRGGRSRHSATSLMQFERCQRRHWFGYVAGLREPEKDGTTDGVGRDGGPGAVVRGQIVHEVLERQGEDDLDILLEDAIGRWDPDAPTPEVPAGRRYRDGLREEIDLVTGQPDYRALAELPSTHRELGFVHFAAPGTIVEGKIDLAAATLDGLVLLDVKTWQGGDDTLAAAADRYALQRDAYVTAVEAIGGQPVARFAFQFSRAARQVSSAVTPADRAAAEARLAALFRSIGSAAPALASKAAECRRCGYRSAGWCAGVNDADS
ncbi:MAG TPA: UvrD-helicase domain-containing protein [Gemmatimonadales bacterium]|nr:UvrD-helicase domain-containing protein [Gemmatimonadales bacterium]